YKIASLTQSVTFESQYFGRGQVDAKALAVANLLRAFMIDEEDRLLFARPSTALTGASAGGGWTISDGTTTNQVYLGGAIGGPAALTAAGTVNQPGVFLSTTGGSIAASASGFDFILTALAGPDHGIGTTESVAGTSATLFGSSSMSGTTNQFVVVPPTIPGAIQYVLYYK